MKDKKREILEDYANWYMKFSDRFADPNADNYVRRKLVEQKNQRLDQALTALENLEKEVEVEEIMELLPNRQIIGECEEQRYIAQALKSKYKITKREDK